MTKRKAKVRAKKQQNNKPRRMEKKPEPMLASEAGIVCRECGAPAEYFAGGKYLCVKDRGDMPAVKLATERPEARNLGLAS